MDVDARVEALESENQRLRDEVDHLKGLLGRRGFEPPLEMRLTGKEGQVLGCLLRGGVKTKDMLMSALYSVGADDEPALKIIDVFVCKLRKKVVPFGVVIETRWGRGYEIAPEVIAAFYARWPRSNSINGAHPPKHGDQER